MPTESSPPTRKPARLRQLVAVFGLAVIFLVAHLLFSSSSAVRQSIIQSQRSPVIQSRHDSNKSKNRLRQQKPVQLMELAAHSIPFTGIRTLSFKPKAAEVSDSGDILKRLLDRRKQLKDFCKSNNASVNLDLNRLSSSSLYMKYISGQKRVLIDTENKLVMCLQAKGGSNFWKYIFTHRMLNGDQLSRSEKATMTDLRFMNTGDLHNEAENLLAESYTLYTFGRNPWHRLVSLYRQKVETALPSSKEYEYINSACLNKIHVDTFESLLRCVVMTSLRGLPDRHWEPLTTRCDLCNLPYDFIGKMENMNEEAQVIFQSAGIKGDIAKFLEDSRKASIRDVEAQTTHVNYTDYYTNIDESLIQSIADIFKHDIVIFGYPTSPL